MEKTKAAGCRNQILHRRTERTGLFTGVPKGFIAIAKEETVDQITAYNRFVFLTFYKASFFYGQENKAVLHFSTAGENQSSLAG